MNHKLTSVCPASSPTVVVTVTKCRGGAVRKRGLDSELLAAFPTSRCGRMFIGLDMAARWEEQASVHVVNQQDIEVLAIQDDDVRHEVAFR